MNDSTPLPPDPASKLTGSMEGNSTPASAFRPRQSMVLLRKYCWIPVAAAALSLASTAILNSFAPPTFVSQARMWETMKLRLPEGALFSEDAQNYLGTQTELLQSEKLRDL